MNYDTKLWNEYTDENEGQIQQKLSDLIYHITLGLGAKKICECGCNVGNNLAGFPNTYDIHGVDLNTHALEKAKKKYPTFNFKHSNIAITGYPDSFFDLVFTRGVLIHIQKTEINNVLKELFRISNKWILNIEYFGDDGKMIKWKRGDDLVWYRDMNKLWSQFNVELISDIDIPLEIDSNKMRLTLVKKKLVN